MKTREVHAMPNFLLTLLLTIYEQMDEHLDT
jgi:hypothetical protein